MQEKVAWIKFDILFQSPSLAEFEVYKYSLADVKYLQMW